MKPINVARVSAGAGALTELVVDPLRPGAVWKSTSELGYLRIIAETFVSLNAIEQT